MAQSRIIDPASNQLNQPFVDLFSMPPTDVTIESASLIELLPYASVDNPPFTFKLNPGTAYYDLSQIYLETSVKVVRIDSGKEVKITDDENVALINGFGATFPQSVHVTIGDNVISQQNGQYGYLSFLSLEMNPKSYKDSILSAAGYYMSGDDPNSATDPGFIKRKALIQGSKPAYFLSRLYTEVNSLERLILPETPIQIEISPWSSQHLIHALNDNIYKIKFQSVKLYTKAYHLPSGLNLDIHSKLLNSVATYNMKKLQIRHHPLPQKITSFNTPLLNSVLPRRIFIGFVGSDSYNGSQKLCPFKFEDFGIEDVFLTYNGIRQPGYPYNNRKDSRNLRPFFDLMNSIGHGFESSTGCGLTPEIYKSRFAIYGFCTTPSLDPGDPDTFQLIRSGNIMINVKFRADSGGVPTSGINMM